MQATQHKPWHAQYTEVQRQWMIAGVDSWNKDLAPIKFDLFVWI
jgi:hypothetical protein